jgi:hypothetical protein
MAEKLTRALEFANYRTTLNNQKAQLRARTQALLSYSFNGGTFTVNQSLIAFVQALITEGYEDAVLLDNYENPVEVSDLLKFKTEILSRYTEATNSYHAEYEKLRKSRKTHKLVGLDRDGK